jgi:hypothetical protein
MKETMLELRLRWLKNYLINVVGCFPADDTAIMIREVMRCEHDEMIRLDLRDGIPH